MDDRQARDQDPDADEGQHHLDGRDARGHRDRRLGRELLPRPRHGGTREVRRPRAECQRPAAAAGAGGRAAEDRAPRLHHDCRRRHGRAGRGVVGSHGGHAELDLLLLGRELQLRLQVADTLAEGDGPLGCRRVTVEEVVPDEGADHDDREHHGHRDDVGLRQHPGLDFALGDHPHRPGPHRVTFPAAAAIAASSADTTSRNRSIRLGLTGENSRTAPRSRAPRSSCCPTPGGPSGSPTTRNAPGRPGIGLAVTPGTVPSQVDTAVGCAWTSSAHRGRSVTHSSSMVPTATIWPELMMPTRSHSRSTRSSWWEEKMTGTPSSVRSRSTALITSTATGSRPENSSSRTSTAGLCTRAAASWTRCWLPRDSFWTGSPRRAPTPSRSVQRSTEARASAGLIPCRPARKRSCSPTFIFGYSPRSSGMYPTVRRTSRSSSVPFQRTCPESAASTPRMLRMAVVLPAPLEPTNPKISPDRTSKLRSRSARNVP